MAKMNWGRVRSENSMSRYGWFRAPETYSTSKKKKRKGARRKLTAEQKAALTAESAARREQKRLAHEARIREQMQSHEAKKRKRAAHEALMLEQKLNKARQAAEKQKADPAKAATRARKFRLEQQRRLSKIVVAKKDGRREVYIKTGLGESTE